MIHIDPVTGKVTDPVRDLVGGDPPSSAPRQVGKAAKKVFNCPFCGKPPTLSLEETEASRDIIGPKEFKCTIECRNECPVNPRLGPMIPIDRAISCQAGKTLAAAIKLWNQFVDSTARYSVL